MEFDKKNFAIGVQCRSGSSRLPKKCFLPFGPLPMWSTCFCAAANTGIRTAILIPENDTELHADLKRTGITDDCIVFGPEMSPLQRFLNLLDKFPEASNIIRITADCPLLSAWMILDCASKFANGEDVFMYNEIDGLDVQICKKNIFAYPCYLDQEHVFNMEKIKDHGLYTKYETHLSVDTMEQYIHAKKLFERNL